MKRLFYIDMTRGFVCILAIFAHAANGQFGVMDEMPVEVLFLLTRSATPSFMVLFGIMLPIVYFRKLGEKRSNYELRCRFVSRSITCYLVYVLISLAAYITGKVSIDEFWRAITYSSGGRFGEILKIYAVLFIIMIFLTPIVQRYRFRALAVVAGLGWVIKIFLGIKLSNNVYQLHFLTGYSTGFGPSIMISLTLVAFGFAVGEMILNQRTSRIPAFMVIAAIAGMIYGIDSFGGLESLAREVGSFRLRSINHPIYFCYGILMVSLWLAVFFKLERLDGRSGNVLNLLSILGTRSLYLYGMGNIVLNLLPASNDLSVPTGLLLSVVYLTFMVMVTLDLARDDSRLDAISGGAFSAYSRMYSLSVRKFSEKLTGLTKSRLSP